MNPVLNQSAVWVTEETIPIPKNIYGVTKTAAEELCQLFYRNHGLPCLVLRTSRFFPEEDDLRENRETYSDENLKANELLYRRVDIEDVVEAHILAMDKALEFGFRKYIITATPPFSQSDLPNLFEDTPSVVRRLFPEYEALYTRLGWKMFPSLDRVYANDRARKELCWEPKYDFKYALDCLAKGQDFQSEMAHSIGKKGYHSQKFEDGPYPVE